MNPPSGFRDGHTLHTMDSALIFKSSIATLAFDHCDDRLVTAFPGFRGFHDVDFQFVSLRKLHVHPEELSGEQRGLIATSSSTDLQKQILLITGIFGC